MDSGWKKPFNPLVSMEIRNIAQKVISHFKDRDIKQISSRERILNEVFRFYKALYGSRETELLNIEIRQILLDCLASFSDNEVEHLEGPLTYAGVLSVLKKMKSN